LDIDKDTLDLLSSKKWAGKDIMNGKIFEMKTKSL